MILTAPGDYPFGAPEPLRHGVSLLYKSLAFQVPTYQILTVYLQKWEFFGLGVVLTAPGGTPEGAPEPQWHGVLLVYNSKVFQVPVYQI